jgi:predicted dehydrogenase
MKIVIIGFCGHTGYALEGIRKNPELKIVGVATANPADINETAAADIIQKHGCLFHEDYRQMLDELRPDVAVIASRYDLNGVVSLECLRRGIHCFTEKAIAHNIEMLNNLKSAATENKVKIIGMHGMRYSPEYYAAYQAVKNGEIGVPVLFTGQKSYKFGQSRPEFYRRRETYGGTILWVAVHAIDWAYWIMGDMNSIQAFHTNQHNFGYGDCETAAAMLFSFKNGGFGTINTDFYQPRKSLLHGDDRMRIAGDKGIINVYEGKAFLTTHDKEMHELPLHDGDFFGDFCREIQGCGICRLSMADTFRVTELGIAARNRADTDSNDSPKTTHSGYFAVWGS